MDITYKALILGLGVLLLIVAQGFLKGKKAGTRKLLTWVSVGLIVAGAFSANIPGLTGSVALFSVAGGGSQNQPLSVGSTGSTGQGTAECIYQPSANYVAIDNFGTTSVGGTSYYKVNGQEATTVAQTSVNRGTPYQYWVSNSTWYVQPANFVADCGVNGIQARAFSNASVSLTAYDLINRQTVTNGVYNTSVGANGQANIEVTYQGTAKASAMPFGGVMVVEYNNTIADVQASGDDISDSTGFHVTYSPSAVGNTYKVFGVAPGIDDGTASVNRINLQFLAGNTDLVNGTATKVTFIPANYYVSNTGAILLDTEKNANSDNTRTGIANNLQVIFYLA